MPAPARVDQYMTTFPTTIGSEESLSTARTKLREHNIHHLPVMEGERLVGVLSDRDIEIVESLEARIGPRDVRAGDVMTRSPYTVGPEARVETVVREMVSRRYGSAVIMSGQRVLGIFTATDALGAFADFIAGRVPATVA